MISARECLHCFTSEHWQCCYFYCMCTLKLVLVTSETTAITDQVESAYCLLLAATLSEVATLWQDITAGKLVTVKCFHVL